MKHSETCNMRFGRKDPKCARCVELINGAPARSGWQKSYYQRKHQQENQRSEVIAAHYRNHEKTCPYVLAGLPCVAFDY